MVSQIIYGNIKAEKLVTWESNKDPYDILENEREINRLGGWNFLAEDKLFSDKVQVDWGSFAYKCTKEQLARLKELTGCEIPELEVIDEQNLGIVFIEQGFTSIAPVDFIF